MLFRSVLYSTSHQRRRYICSKVHLERLLWLRAPSDTGIHCSSTEGYRLQMRREEKRSSTGNSADIGFSGYRIQRISYIVAEDHRVTAREVTEQVYIVVGTAYSIMNNELQSSHVCARWVKCLLTDDQSYKRILRWPKTATIYIYIYHVEQIVKSWSKL